MPPKCTKCNRPRRGHSGPTDEECTLTEAGPGYGLGLHEELSFDSEQEEKDKLSEAGGGGHPNVPPSKSLPQERRAMQPSL